MYFVIPIGWSIMGEAVPCLDKPADWLDLSRPMTTLADGQMAVPTGLSSGPRPACGSVWCS